MLASFDYMCLVVDELTQRVSHVEDVCKVMKKKVETVIPHVRKWFKYSIFYLCWYMLIWITVTELSDMWMLPHCRIVHNLIYIHSPWGGKVSHSSSKYFQHAAYSYELQRNKTHHFPPHSPHYTGCMCYCGCPPADSSLSPAPTHYPSQPPMTLSQEFPFLHWNEVWLKR